MQKKSLGNNMESINEIYDRLKLHKWWSVQLPDNSIIHELKNKKN